MNSRTTYAVYKKQRLGVQLSGRVFALYTQVLSSNPHIRIMLEADKAGSE